MAILSLISKAFTEINKDGHVMVGLFVFSVGSLIHVFHGLDASFVSFTTTVLAFLGGHAWVKSRGESNDSSDTDPKP